MTVCRQFHRRTVMSLLESSRWSPSQAPPSRTREILAWSNHIGNERVNAVFGTWCRTATTMITTSRSTTQRRRWYNNNDNNHAGAAAIALGEQTGDDNVTTTTMAMMVVAAAVLTASSFTTAHSSTSSSSASSSCGLLGLLPKEEELDKELKEANKSFNQPTRPRRPPRRLVVESMGEDGDSIFLATDVNSTSTLLYDQYQVDWNAPVLGRGAFGNVYFGLERSSSSSQRGNGGVAIKRMDKCRTDLEGFQREIAALFQIQKQGGHTHILAMKGTCHLNHINRKTNLSGKKANHTQ